jgi:hypothetical protein
VSRAAQPGPPPKATVLLQTYRHEPFIAQAIESVLIQRVTFPFELVIAEDCSPDGTRAIVEEYAGRHPHLIRTVLPERNIGSGEIFVRALESARGEYVACLDGDDYWTSPDKLRRQVEALEDHSDWATCFHDVSLIYGEEGQPSGFVVPGLERETFGIEDILRTCFIPGPTWMVRRSALWPLPPWLVEHAWSDWLIHIGAAQRGAIGYLPEPLAAYRVHAGGMFSSVDRSTQLEEDLRLYERLYRELPQHRELIERCVVDRRCQLAVEESRLSYEVPLLVVEQEDDMPLYFNGRHVRRLPPAPAAPTDWPAEIGTAVRELRSLPVASHHYDPRVEPKPPGGARAYLVIPRTSAGWLAREGDLRAHLASQGTPIWADDWCTIHELTTGPDGQPHDQAAPEEPSSPSIEVLEVSLSEPLPDGLRGAQLDAPRAGGTSAAHALYIVGWALGTDAPTTAVEFELGREVVWRAPLGADRPDLAEAFPDRPDAGGAGFRTTVNLSEATDGFELGILAVLQDGTRASIGTIRGR